MVDLDFGDDFKLTIEDENTRLIAGWASVEIVDTEGHVIDVKALSKAMIKYMMGGAPIQLGHTSSPVGRVVFWMPKKHPDSGKIGVYIGAVINKSDELDDEVWKSIKEGKYKGFSIGGYATSVKDAILKDASGDNVNVKYVDGLILKEISIVTMPANPFANIEKVNEIAKGTVEMEPIVKEIKSKDELRRILIGILDEAKKVRGYVNDHSDSGAYKGMADDIVKTLAALINELDNGVIDIKKSYYDPELEELEAKILIQKALIKGDNLRLYNAISKAMTGKKFEKVCPEIQVEIVKIANDVIKKADDKSRYMEGGHFKEMSCPDDPDNKSRFCGCVRFQQSQGYSLEAAKKICAKIKQMKYGG